MILFCAQSNVIHSYKFFFMEPVKRIEPNTIAGQVDVRFDPQSGDQPFDVWNFEKLFPSLVPAETTVTKFLLVEKDKQTVEISVLEKNLSVRVVTS